MPVTRPCCRPSSSTPHSQVQRTPLQSDPHLVQVEHLLDRDRIAVENTSVYTSAGIDQVTRRIHVARYIDLEQSDWNERAFEAHRKLVRLLADRNLDGGLAALTDHIDMSLKRAVSISKEMVARFFLADHGVG